MLKNIKVFEKSAVIHGTRDKIKDGTKMGMSASQARLLAITARIHDVEYQAQSIQNAKIQLSTQQDAVYEEYQKALDAAVITIAAIDGAGNKSTVVANFNTMFSINRVTPAIDREYALKTKRGQVVVPADIASGYEKFKAAGYPDSPFMFAMFMMDKDGSVDSPTTLDGEEMQILSGTNGVLTGETDPTFEGEQNAGLKRDLVRILKQFADLTGQKWENFCNGNGGTPGATMYIMPHKSSEYNIESWYKDPARTPEEIAKYHELLNQFQEKFYQIYAAEMWAKVNGDVPEAADFDKKNLRNDFDYYVSKFKQIEECGYKSISDFDGILGGDAANDSDFLTNMIQSGQLYFETVSFDSNGHVCFNGTSPGSDDCVAYTNETSIDKVALAKAEAKYEKSMKQIDKKEQQLDLSLTKLETERGALTKEYDSVKKVIEDNVQRTFGIFS